MTVIKQSNGRRIVNVTAALSVRCSAGGRGRECAVQLRIHQLNAR